MGGIYAITYRWRGRPFHTVVAGADRKAAVAEFRREFPHVRVEGEGDSGKVTGVSEMMLCDGREAGNG